MLPQKQCCVPSRLLVNIDYLAASYHICNRVPIDNFVDWTLWQAYNVNAKREPFHQRQLHHEHGHLSRVSQEVQETRYQYHFCRTGQTHLTTT